MQDMNANKESDFIDAMKDIKSTDEFQQTMNFEQGKERTKQSLNADKNNISREKMQTQLAMKQMDVNIAKENKNQFDLKKKAQENAKNNKKK